MRHLGYIGVGAALSLLMMMLLYGVNGTAMMLFYAVVCTAGIGLIPIIFISWLVGWAAFAVGRALSRRSQTPRPTPSPPTP